MTKRILIHALIISGADGTFLTHIIRNPELDEAVLSGFISALNIFGSHTLGKIGDISISGLDINLLVIHKYSLMCIAVMDSDIPELSIREGCEIALDTFYQKYVQEIDNFNGRLTKFSEFKPFLEGQIQGYFAKLKEHEKEQKAFSDDASLKEKELSPEELIEVLKKDIIIYQQANSSLHEKNRELEEKIKELEEKIKNLESSRK